jgi:hypothetical protein
VYQQLLMIDENRAFTIVSGTTATGTISDNDGSDCSHDTPASATEEVLLCLNSA